MLAAWVDELLHFFLALPLFSPVSPPPFSSLSSFLLSFVPVLTPLPCSYFFSSLSLCLSQTFVNILTGPRVTLISRIMHEAWWWHSGNLQNPSSNSLENGNILMRRRIAAKTQLLHLILRCRRTFVHPASLTRLPWPTRIVLTGGRLAKWGEGWLNGGKRQSISFFITSMCIIFHISSAWLQIFAYKSEGRQQTVYIRTKANFWKNCATLHLWNLEISMPVWWQTSWQVNTTLMQSYTVISFAQTSQCCATSVKRLEHWGREERIYLDLQKGI